jgi:hypothetical protein
VEDLDRRGIITKRRHTKVRKYNGGIPFTYGPLAYFLKNRIYIGETGHKDKWFQGEHTAIVNRKTFDQVQQLLASKSAGRRALRSASEALLTGKLYDDHGNVMSPSFSTKNGIRYRFYVSSALLRGRKTEAGSVRRVASATIESLVVQALRDIILPDSPIDDAVLIDRHLGRIELGRKGVTISYRGIPDQGLDDAMPTGQIRLPWSADTQTAPPSAERGGPERSAQPDPKAAQAIARAKSWAAALSDGKYASVEELAASAKLHAKVVRNELRLAFLSPDIVDAVLNGSGGFGLRDLRKCAALKWRIQQTELHESHQLSL